MQKTEETRENIMQEITRSVEHMKFQLESTKLTLGHIQYLMDTLLALDKTLEKPPEKEEIPAA